MFQQNNNVWQVLNNLPEHNVENPQTDHQIGNGTPQTPQNACVHPDSHKICMGTDLHHRSVPILPTLLAMLIIQVGVLTAVFVVPVFSATLPATTNAFSVLQYVYVLSWSLIAFLTHRMKREFHMLWILGYHSFHCNTRHLHAAGCHVYTAGLVLLLVLGTAVRDYCPGGPLVPCSGRVQLSPVRYQQILVTMQTIVALVINLKLCGDVYQFNKSELPADVLVDDLGVRLSQSTLQPSSLHTVMEAQGATIATLRRHMEVLNGQVALLANALENYFNP